MKYTASHIELGRKDAYLLGLPREQTYRWNETAVLKAVTRLELDAELDRECSYVEEVCDDIDIAMMSTANQRFQTERLVRLMMRFESETG